MTQTFIKSGVALAVMVVAYPSIFSMILLIPGAIYFLSALKMKIIDVNYGGSWRAYFRSWITHFKK